jgi:hypothetical protein
VSASSSYSAVDRLISAKYNTSTWANDYRAGGKRYARRPLCACVRALAAPITTFVVLPLASGGYNLRPELYLTQSRGDHSL